ARTGHFGPIYPRLGLKLQGIRGSKVQNGLCELQWKKVPLNVLFSTVHRTTHLIFHQKSISKLRSHRTNPIWQVRREPPSCASSTLCIAIIQNPIKEMGL